MSPSRNAEEFRQKYLQIRSRYEAAYRELIIRIRAKYINNGERRINRLTDESLEAHFREYFATPLLEALNWHLSVTVNEQRPNLVPESPVTAVSRGTILRLDYFGFERETLKPLMVVETKHPQSTLPKRKKSLEGV